MKEPILEYVSRRLNEHKGSWPRISKETGVEYDTMAKVAQGTRKNPTIANLQPLVDWFEAYDDMISRVRRKESA